MVTSTATMIPPFEAEPASVDTIDPILEIMADAELSIGEKLLLIEALLVHDHTPEPLPALAAAAPSPSR